MIKIEPLIAHRGASSYAPENTMAAFNKAYALGIRAVEFDVMMSADGGLFVFHDDTLERTSNGRGEFSTTASDVINQLDAGAWFSRQCVGEKVPYLSEVLQWCVTHQVQANIELKPSTGCVQSTIDAFLTCLTQYWPSDTQLPLVSCFNQDVLRLCASKMPALPLGVLLHQWKNNWEDIAKEVRAVSVHLNQYIITRKRIKLIQDAGYQVCIYTVNAREWAARFFAWGADSVLTDYPDLMDE
jgi:glycerophosphoryl diester phosphodiesterase